MLTSRRSPLAPKPQITNNSATLSTLTAGSKYTLRFLLIPNLGSKIFAANTSDQELATSPHFAQFPHTSLISAWLLWLIFSRVLKAVKIRSCCSTAPAVSGNLPAAASQPGSTAPASTTIHFSPFGKFMRAFYNLHE